MVVLGVDVHKDTHTIVGVDEVGRQVCCWTVAARDHGHELAITRACREFPVERVWAVEDCRHVSGRLERALLAAGERCLRVPPKLMAGQRRSARTRGKSDPIDALAIARAGLVEPGLAVAELGQDAREVKLLVDHRDHLIAERTRLTNRLRWHLHDLDPDLEASIGVRGMNAPNVLTRLGRRLARQPQTIQVRICREQVRDITGLTRRINDLERELTVLARELAPQLLQIPGCGPLTAAKLIGEIGNPARFRTEACFAMHAGVAPIPASSGRTDRHRLARGGNRQINAALHRIALTQTRIEGEGKDYYQRRRAQGDTFKDALRVMKRKIARRVIKALNTQTTSTTTTEIAAAA